MEASAPWRWVTDGCSGTYATSARRDRQATVDELHRAGHVRRGGRQEEGDDARDLVGPGVAAQRDAREHRVVLRVARRRAAARRVHHPALDGPRADGVD